MKKVHCSICNKEIYRWNYQVKSQEDFYCDNHKKYIGRGKHHSPQTEFKKGQSKTKSWYKSMKKRINWNTGLTEAITTRENFRFCLQT